MLLFLSFSSMLLQLSLLHLVIFLHLPQPISSSSNPIAKNGCPDRCGNLTIPYPFGVGSGCCHSESFNITCNTSTHPPKPMLYINHLIEVLEITSSQIRIKNPYLLNTACYNESGNLNVSYEGIWYLVDWSQTQYTFSDENWLTAVGCDDLVLQTGKANKSFGSGCVAYCASAGKSGGTGFCVNNDNGYSPGNGCCRTPIQRGTTWLGAQLSDLSGQWKRRKLYPCSYAFVEEKVISNQSRFSFPLHYLQDYSKEFGSYDLKASKPSVVRLDWRTGADINCSQAKLYPTTYACQNNTQCIDFDTIVGGYNCRCLDGYEGNPYLTGGCIDINECIDINSCAEDSDCVNTVGSFNCLCRKGYYGNGRLNGTGCSRLPTSKHFSVAIGLSSGSGFLLLLAICFWLHKVVKKTNEKKRKEKFFKRNGGFILEEKTNEGTIRKTKHYPAKELEKATDHYNESRILGQGGQGTVYKGMLSDGKIVAIKKLKQVDEDQLEQFINEIVILSQVDHTHVVKLMGCCLETEVPLLIYEFAPNGTLFNAIHDPDNQFPISWNMRLRIAADIAGALAYLHYSCSIPIYHRDIKSSNILLGEKFVVKVSDFGTSKSVEVEKTHLTTMVKGTFGYLDPEYFQSGQFTDKSDVYSFGVVLVELLTRQRPISSTQDEKSLATRFLTSIEEHILDSILDPLVKEQGQKEEVIAIARIAQRCLNLKGKMRPTMKEVATELARFSNIAQLSSTVEDEYKEAKVYEPKPMTISDIEYTWNTNGNSEISSSSDTYPFMYEAV